MDIETQSNLRHHLTLLSHREYEIFGISFVENSIIRETFILRAVQKQVIHTDIVVYMDMDGEFFLQIFLSYLFCVAVVRLVMRDPVVIGLKGTRKRIGLIFRDQVWELGPWKQNVLGTFRTWYTPRIKPPGLSLACQCLKCPMGL